MIVLEVQCPRCKRKRKWLSYDIKKREDLYGKQTECYYCHKKFVIKGETMDRIVKEIKYDGH